MVLLPETSLSFPVCVCVYGPSVNPTDLRAIKLGAK